MANKKTELDNHSGGLLLMIIFTTVWTILSEIFFNNSDHRITAVFFGIIIAYFIYSYLKLIKNRKVMPEIQVIRNPKKEKWFYAVFALEGVAIFIVQNILVNIHKENLSICSIALIVGLHFIPLAKVFDRKFDYCIGIWTSLIATIGLILILKNQFNYKIVNAFVCIGCALSTTMYGLKKVRDGNNFLKRTQS